MGDLFLRLLWGRITGGEAVSKITDLVIFNPRLTFLVRTIMLTVLNI